MRLSSLTDVAKVCKKCGKLKALDEFPSSGRHDGSTKGECKECFRVRWNAWRQANAESHRAAVARYRKSRPDRRLPDRVRKYGLTAAMAHEMLAAQQGGCAICYRSIDFTTPGLCHVDHNHDTNEVRALLCRYCNVMLGQAFDDPAVLRAAAAYLEDHS